MNYIILWFFLGRTCVDLDITTPLMTEKKNKTWKVTGLLLIKSLTFRLSSGNHRLYAKDTIRQSAATAYNIKGHSWGESFAFIRQAVKRHQYSEPNGWVTDGNNEKDKREISCKKSFGEMLNIQSWLLFCQILLINFGQTYSVIWLKSQNATKLSYIRDQNANMHFKYTEIHTLNLLQAYPNVQFCSHAHTQTHRHTSTHMLDRQKVLSHFLSLLLREL